MENGIGERTRSCPFTRSNSASSLCASIATTTSLVTRSSRDKNRPKSSKQAPVLPRYVCVALEYLKEAVPEFALKPHAMLEVALSEIQRSCWCILEH